MHLDYPQIYHILSSLHGKKHGGTPLDTAAEVVPEYAALFAAARKKRDAAYGRDVYLRGVVEFSNICKQNCLYCGLRVGNHTVQRFRLHEQEILDAVAVAVDCGMGTVVLQAGEDIHVPSMAKADRKGEMVSVAASASTGEETPPFTAEGIAKLVSTIKERYDVAITLSLGDQPDYVYALWRESGADRYLLKLETTDEALHGRMRPGQTVMQRLKRVEKLQELGFETGSGIITGLPGMTPEMLAKDILQLSSMGLSMLAAGPFIPHRQTPLGDSPFGRLDQSLVVTACLRILNPLANIPATSALDALVANGRELGLDAGANVIMPSVTPASVRKQYNIYPGKNIAQAPVLEAVGSIKERIRCAGYAPCNAKGFSKVQGEDI